MVAVVMVAEAKAVGRAAKAEEAAKVVAATAEVKAVKAAMVEGMAAKVAAKEVAARVAAERGLCVPTCAPRDLSRVPTRHRPT